MNGMKPVDSGSRVERREGSSDLEGGRLSELLELYCEYDVLGGKRRGGGKRWAYIRQRRTSSRRSTPSFESSCDGCWIANKLNASRISASWVAVRPCSLASLEGRFGAREARFAAARRVGGWSDIVRWNGNKWILEDEPCCVCILVQAVVHVHRGSCSPEL